MGVVNEGSKRGPEGSRAPPARPSRSSCVRRRPPEQPRRAHTFPQDDLVRNPFRHEDWFQQETKAQQERPLLQPAGRRPSPDEGSAERLKRSTSQSRFSSVIGTMGLLLSYEIRPYNRNTLGPAVMTPGLAGPTPCVFRSDAPAAIFRSRALGRSQPPPLPQHPASPPPPASPLPGGPPGSHTADLTLRSNEATLLAMPRFFFFPFERAFQSRSVQRRPPGPALLQFFTIFGTGGGARRPAVPNLVHYLPTDVEGKPGN